MLNIQTYIFQYGKYCFREDIEYAYQIIRGRHIFIRAFFMAVFLLYVLIESRDYPTRKAIHPPSAFSVSLTNVRVNDSSVLKLSSRAQ